MELRQIKYFVAVAEDLNISQAARRLHTSQPSLGRQIQSLEDFIGVPLFNRKNRRLTLTEAGEIFLARSKNILSDINDATLKARSASHGNKKSITIGYIPTVASKIFPFFLPYLQNNNPDIYPILKNISSEVQITALKNECIDIAFVRKGADDDDIEKEVILRENLVVLLPAAHPLAEKTAVTLTELSALPFVEVSTPLKMELEQTFGPLNFKSLGASGSGERDSLFDQFSLVGSGLGFTILSDFVREFAPPSVAVRDLAVKPPPRTELYIAYRKHGRSAVLTEFLQALHRWKSQMRHLGEE